MLALLVTLQTFASSVQDRLSREEKGATAVEYGLIVGFIALAIVAALTLLAPTIADVFGDVNTSVGTVPDVP